MTSYFPRTLAAARRAATRLAASCALFALGFAIPTAAGVPVLISPAHAVDAAFSDEQKKAIGEIIKDYLIKNPELIVEVQQALEIKMEKEQAEKLKTFMSENAKDIYRNPESPVAGDPNGDITVVEFFDYNCGYCKRGMTEVQKLVQSDKRVRVVFKELPILSKGSEETARAALAAKRQGKYWEFHQAMLSSKGQANEATSLKAAEALGLDMAKLKADMAGDAVKGELEAMKALAKKMGINGTPHFLVGDKSIPGAPEDLHDQLKTLIADFRKSGCSYC